LPDKAAPISDRWDRNRRSRNATIESSSVAETVIEMK
jgi:hypothetical protein